MSLDRLLSGSFPNPGDAERVRQIIVDDEGKDTLGMEVQRIDADFHFSYPIAMLVAGKSARKDCQE